MLVSISHPVMEDYTMYIDKLKVAIGIKSKQHLFPLIDTRQIGVSSSKYSWYNKVHTSQWRCSRKSLAFRCFVKTRMDYAIVLGNIESPSERSIQGYSQLTSISARGTLLLILLRLHLQLKETIQLLFPEKSHNKRNGQK